MRPGKEHVVQEFRALEASAEMNGRFYPTELPISVRFHRPDASLRWMTSQNHAALADRLRKALSGRRSLAEKRMFGGVCFLLKGWIAMAERYVGALPAKKK